MSRRTTSRPAGAPAPDSAPPRPIANAYWVAPRMLLAGEYPGGKDEQATRARIDALLAAGIDAFIDLTAPDERVPYQPSLPAHVEYHRRPIVDHGLPEDAAQMQQIQQLLRAALERGRRVYVHCRAGIGRTGTVVGCYLVETGYSGEQALAVLNELWLQSARSSSWLTVPETPEQEKFVRDWNADADADVDVAVDLGDPDELEAARRLRERFHGALVGLAIGDALAAATQFRKRGKFAPIGDLLGGGPFDVPRGAWTDDTAMALCLAESLLESSGFDARDQVERYTRWQRAGHLSATGQCLGITASVARALSAAQWRRQLFAGSHDPKALEKDPLVRVAPAVMFYFASAEDAIAQAAQAARVTAQSAELLAACRLFAAMLHAALSGLPKAEVLGPERAAWRGRSGVSARLAALAAHAAQPRNADELNPSGDALDALEAALWAFSSTEDFRSGALEAANLGGDSDAITAIYGQLAGAHYGLTAIPAAWRASLVRKEVIEDLADRLLTQAMVELGRLT